MMRSNASLRAGGRRGRRRRRGCACACCGSGSGLLLRRHAFPCRQLQPMELLGLLGGRRPCRESVGSHGVVRGDECVRARSAQVEDRLAVHPGQLRHDRRRRRRGRGRGHAPQVARTGAWATKRAKREKDKVRGGEDRRNKSDSETRGERGAACAICVSVCALVVAQKESSLQGRSCVMDASSWRIVWMGLQKSSTAAHAERRRVSAAPNLPARAAQSRLAPLAVMLYLLTVYSSDQSQQ